MMLPAVRLVYDELKYETVTKNYLNQKRMKITLVQVTKTHAWTIGLKGYIFQVVPHESEPKSHKDDKKYWQVLNSDYTYNPIGIRAKKTKSCYLLQKTHVEVIGAMEVK